ncbi:arginine N-succinyltransferase [Natronospirillum operosum]|uniref:Arginine N-succinyltransferase n=1 Tax=Natronospirillum operosum TaxID=2759953 RepID=A0A4Z0WDW9_9GAMM|nr:arginine N-succinyltransferase [Natronospirillum operosum]TGG92323.1 arginine N-succinyltransferase [Natronospirillum operosum]
MWHIKPLTAADLGALEALLHANPLRLSTLPAVRDQLAERIAAAEQGFAGLDGEATLLFGLRDHEDSLLGVAGIQPYAGGDEPFYSYRIDELVHASRHLGINQRQSVLYLSHELTGLTSLCSFSLTPSLRDSQAFELLSRSRLLYIASHRHAFADELVVEIQGIWDNEGQSEFWKNVGELFFGLDFITADHQCALHGKTVIAELLPPYPIYQTLLSAAAQQAIARHHPGAERTVRWLEHEGLYKTRFVDPFDAGPTYRGRVDDLASLQSLCSVTSVQQGQPTRSTPLLLAQGTGSDFVCRLVQGDLQADSLITDTDLTDTRPGLVLPLETH